MKLMSIEKMKEFKEWLEANPQANEKEQVEKYREMLESDTEAVEVS